MALEALFLHGEEGLSFRLAQRAANLLGADSEERKRIFKELKDLYDVRSRIIHGDNLRQKHASLLDNVARLRELVRRSLLSALALSSEPSPPTGFYKELDAMSLDADVREALRQRASAYVSLTPQPLNEEPTARNGEPKAPS